MKKKEEDIQAKYDKLADMASHELVRHKPGYYVAKGDERILMPMQTALMHSDMSKMQQNIVLAVIEGMKEKLQEYKNMKEAGMMRDLFAEQEIADDPRPIKFKLLFKDFGVLSSNYPKLAAAMRMMSKVPVSLPYRGTSGVMYTKTTAFCTVYIPDERSYQKYCIVSMEPDVAERLLKFDIGYLYVGKHTSWKLTTKYSERLYWYIKAHVNRGGVTESMENLRKMFGAEKKFKKSGDFEKYVLRPSADEIKELFDKGECECWFEYEKIYNDKRKYKRKKPGEPDAILFKMHGSQKNISLENANVEEETIEEDILFDEIHNTLLTELGLSEALVKKYMAMVNEDNKEPLMSKLITIKIQLDQKAEDKKPVKNRQGYVVRSLNNFFENENNEKKYSKVGEESKVKADAVDEKMSYPDRWIAIVQRLCQYRSDEQMRETFDNVCFDSFNPHTGALMLCVVGEGVCERIENSQQDIDLLSRLLREYFDFKSFKWRSFTSREDFLKYKRNTANQ